MRFDEFTKARLKITFFISIISTIILSAFGGTVYYFYKEQIVYEISDNLKSYAFEIARRIEISPYNLNILSNMNIPEDYFVCVYNYSTSMLFYEGKMCNFKQNFEGFKVIKDDVVFGITFTKNFDHIHIYVGKSLKNTLSSLQKLKGIIFYSFFVISIIIFVFAFYISKYIISPLKKSIEKQEKFIQNVSHDLKTPLSIISSNLYLIKQKDFKNIENNFSTLEKNVNFMKKLVSDMLFMAKIGTKEKEKINVNSILKETLENFEPKIKEKQITVNLIEKKHITIEANTEDIKTMFNNLIENAIKYNRDKGYIEIILEKNSVSIKNTGELINIKEKDKIFDRFYRGDTSRTTEGSGLGLSIVKDIAESYGFKIKLNISKDYNEFIIKF